MKKSILTAILVLLTAGPASAQVDFTRYVALGDSLTAGFASGSLMNWYQERSFPAVLARQGGASGFEQPLISEPGIGPVLELVALFQNGQLAPTIAPVGLLPGLPTAAGIDRDSKQPGFQRALAAKLFAMGQGGRKYILDHVFGIGAPT